ncbi:MAG: hypothetical protein QOH75_1998 [Actinomycetota bacterium]|nr:hypothetical protein [Actinomycetota bacterium]
MAYSTLMTAALTGATLRQLSHWRNGTTGAVLRPEISEQRPILYSFSDLIALRTCVYLRQETSLQKIRRAIHTLRDLGEREHLSRYRLVAQGRSIVLVDDGGAVDLVHRPGQQVVAVMADVLAPFTKESGQVVPDLYRPRTEVVVEPQTQGGVPVIRGTRVPYDVVAGLVLDGVGPAEVSRYYPRVGAAAAIDAADFESYVCSYKDNSAASDVA